MTLVLDAGALLAVERGDRELMKGKLRLRRAPVTHGDVVGQVWRSAAARAAGSRSRTSLAAYPDRLYNGIEVQRAA